MTNVLARRHMLKMGAGVGAAFVLPEIASGRNLQLPDVGSKFDAEGRVLPFAGNTVICHLPQQGEYAGPFRGLLDIYRELPRHDFARKLTLLPPSSYHMTVFGGANDRQRIARNWPADISLNVPIDECTRLLNGRLEDFELGSTSPIRMRVALDESPMEERPLKIRLTAVDAAQERRLRDLRDRLAVRLRLRSPTHDNYEFHITLAYIYRLLSPSEHRAFRAMRTQWHERLAANYPVIHLPLIEFCRFPDMFYFERLAVLR